MRSYMNDEGDFPSNFSFLSLLFDFIFDFILRFFYKFPVVRLRSVYNSLDSSGDFKVYHRQPIFY